jgi:hypothetical protein
MEKPRKFPPLRLEIVIAILIAVVSITVAMVTWRNTLVSSRAGETSRTGILDTIKKQAIIYENWRKTYQEAGYAEMYAVYLAELETLETSADPSIAYQAENLRLYMLPNLGLLAGELVSDPAYLNPDGTYNLEARFTSLKAEDPILRDLDPQVSFQRAGLFYAEQRWLTVNLVMLAISLFWLALAEIGGKRLRMLTLLLGCGVYALALIHLAVIEVYFVIAQGGAL